VAKLSKKGLLLCSLFGSSTLVAIMVFWQLFNAPMNIAQTGEWLDVEPGTSLSQLASELSDRGIFKFPYLLSMYGRLSGQATRMQAGEYLVQPETAPKTLLKRLVGGDVYLHQITFIEGWQYSELIAALHDHDAIDLSNFNSETIMANLGLPNMHPEGQFFPDTYWFPRGITAISLLRQAHIALTERLNRAWSSYSAKAVLVAPYEALILASIIEKETRVAAERVRISGVFHRRLMRGMRLQTDPTVIYGLGSDYTGRLSRTNLTQDTPYNTYTRNGLPPTPIALVGQASLSAAVNPQLGSAIYFVATGRDDGSHYFSSTLEEHNAAVDRYLKQTESIH